MNSVTLFLIELVIVLFLGYIAKRKAEERLEKFRATKVSEKPEIKPTKGKLAVKEEKLEIKPKKPFRIEQVIIIAIYLITFSLIGYLYIANMHPEIINENNIVKEKSAGDIGLFSKLSTIYIDNKDVFGPEEKINNTSVRKVISTTPFNIVFNPKSKIKENSTGTLEISFLGSGSEIYLDDKLIVPDISDYELIKDFDNEAVYARNDYKYDELIDRDNINEFLYKNFHDVTIYSFKSLSNYIPILDDYSDKQTLIDTTFRGDLKLAVYAQGDLYIRFVKQDLNDYVGKDEYTVEVKDFKGESYFSKIYEDDGYGSDSGKDGPEQSYKIELKDLPRGIYYISFTKDKNNKSPDSTIKNININSNKVLIIGNSLPIKPFNFYTKVYSSKKIGFYYWHTGKDQVIAVSGVDNKDINLDTDWINKRYDREFKQGDYNFKCPKGDLWIYSDVISLNKEGWFDLPIKTEAKLANPDLLIIDKNKLKIDSNEFSYKGEVILKDQAKYQLKFLDKNKLYLEDIKLNGGN